MCFSKPKIPAAAAPAPIPPPPPPPAEVQVGSNDELKQSASLKAKKLGKQRLQVPLGGTGGSGLGIPV